MDIGIDLGTTNSEVAIYLPEGVRVLPIDGDPVMPSVVGIEDSGDLLVGRVAKNQGLASPESTVTHVKRQMGDPSQLMLGDQLYSPEQISAMILTRLKQAAEAELKKTVTSAVITVPAFFNEKQRRATMEAAALAGFEKVELLNEPTAAALAYTLGSQSPEGLFLVYDWGGGTFDVSVVHVTDAVCEVKASHGDVHLGGSDLDALLAEKVRAAFKGEHEVDLKEQPVAWARLLNACEAAKIRLSDEAFTEILEEFITSKNGVPIHLRMRLTRPELEALALPLVERTIQSVHKALEMAGVKAEQLNHVILVGGASMLPLVTFHLTREIGLAPQYWHDPSLIVAIGASLHAARLDGRLHGAPLLDVLSHTLGLEVGSGYNHRVEHVLYRNTPLPCQASQIFYKMYPGTDHIEIVVRQGESHQIEKTEEITTIELKELAKSGAEILVRFKMDRSGVLFVEATDVLTGKQAKATIQKGGKERVLSGVRGQDIKPTKVEAYTESALNQNFARQLIALAAQQAAQESDARQERLEEVFEVATKPITTDVEVVELEARDQISVAREIMTQLSAEDAEELAILVQAAESGDQTALEKLEQAVFSLS